jgi:cell division septation protein DedD
MTGGMRLILVALGLLAAVPAVGLLPAVLAAASVASGAAKWRAGDWAGAVADWERPAAAGDPDALFNMGQAYRLGRGVPRDGAAAVDHYRRAASRGHLGATANLGIALFQDGRKAEAVGHLRDAAGRGDLRAAYVLGVATFTGDGAARNPALGYAYVVRARDGGLDIASGQAARMATLITPADRARGEAAAAALAAGRPIPVELASAAPARGVASPQATAAASEDEAEAEAAASTQRAAGSGRPRPKDAGEAGGAKRAARSEEARRAGGDRRREGEEAARTGEPGQAPDPAAEGGYRVQLGAYANERAARSAWAALVAQSAELLKGMAPVYAPRGGLVRLQVGPFKGRGAARQLCAKLAAAGRPCFVTEGGEG